MKELLTNGLMALVFIWIAIGLYLVVVYLSRKNDELVFDNDDFMVDDDIEE